MDVTDDGLPQEIHRFSICVRLPPDGMFFFMKRFLPNRDRLAFPLFVQFSVFFACGTGAEHDRHCKHSKWNPLPLPSFSGKWRHFPESERQRRQHYYVWNDLGGDIEWIVNWHMTGQMPGKMRFPFFPKWYGWLMETVHLRDGGRPDPGINPGWLHRTNASVQWQQAPDFFMAVCVCQSVSELYLNTHLACVFLSAFSWQHISPALCRKHKSCGEEKGSVKLKLNPGLCHYGTRR